MRHRIPRLRRLRGWPVTPGETVKAFVSLRAGESVDVDALVAHARERLAAYKVPRLVEIVEELPKTASPVSITRVVFE